MVSLGARANRSKDSKVSCFLTADDDDEEEDDANGGDTDVDDANVWLDRWLD